MKKNNLIRKVKQTTAGLLAGAMVLTGAPLGNLTAMAAGLSPNSNLSPGDGHSNKWVSQVDGFTYGSSDSTTFAFGNASGHNSTDGYGARGGEDTFTFGLGGLKSSKDRTNNTRGYYPGATSVHTGAPGTRPDIFTQYGSNWWHGYYSFGKPYRIGTDAERTDYAASGATVYTQPNSANPAEGPADVYTTVWSGDQPQTSVFQGSSRKKELHVAGHTYVNGQVLTLTDGGKTIELRQEIKPSDDDQYIAVQYTAYNPSATDTIDFMVGNETDTMLPSQDDVPIFTTRHGAGEKFEGLHFQSHTSSTYPLTVFDVYSSGNGAGMVKRDSNDPSENRVWGMRYIQTGSHYHTDWVFSQGFPGMVNAGDSAAAFSAYFNLKPREQKTATFMIAIKPSVYYVSDGSGNTGTSGQIAGFMGRPINSVKDAIDDIRTRGIKKAYIYLQDDAKISETLTIPNGTEITIQTADFNNPNLTTYTGYQKFNPSIKSNTATLKRADGFTGELFKMGDNDSMLNFRDVIVDGNKDHATATAPAFDLDKGKVSVKAGTVIKEFKVTGAKVPSVFKISGTGVLDINAAGGSAAIKNNISLDDGAAIDSTDSGLPTGKYPITVNGSLDVTGSKMYNGTFGTADVKTKDGNVLIRKKPIFVESGNSITGTMGIGMTGDALPTTNSEGSVLADYADRTSGGSLPYSPANFQSDISGQTIGAGDGVKTVAHEAAGTLENSKVIYLHATIYTFALTYLKPDGSSFNFADFTIPSPVPSTENYVDANPYSKGTPAGGEIKYNIPAISGYKYDASANPAMNLPDSISIDANGNLTGTMPGENVSIRINLIKDEATYKFDPQNGSAVPDKTEPTGATSNISVPQSTRLGYDLVGWQQYNDANGNGIFDSGDTDIGGVITYPSGSFPTPVVTGVKKFYAKWTPGSGTFAITRKFTNKSLSTPITFFTDVDNTHHVADSFTKDPIGPIPGYIYDSGTKTPNTAATGTIAPATDAHPGRLTVTSMPPLAIALYYKYSVDPSQRFTFEVRHEDLAGNVIAPTTTVTRLAEQQISAAKKNDITGFSYSTFTVTQGRTAPSTPLYTIGIDDGVNNLIIDEDLANGNFVAKMPNQNVTIVFKYTNDSGNNLIKRYFDRVDNTVLASEVVPHMAGTTFVEGLPTSGANLEKIYGYVWDTSSSVDQNPTTLGSITNPTTGEFTGTMPVLPPATPTKVDWMLSRDASKWTSINFAVASAPYNNGSVGATTANSILLSDGTSAGDARAYKFSKIKALNYVPSVTPNRYYMFDGWYKDAACTQPVGDTDFFRTTDPTPLTVYAKFVEDPSKWFDINFAAGSNGSISAPATLHVPYDYTWSQVAALPSALLPTAQLPTATPVANYLFNGWKDPNGAFMQGSSTLTNHATYTAFFSQDPNVFGTIGSITPTGRIGNDGSGEIVIDGTTPGNVYVISDPNGNIVAVVPGDSTGNRTVVPNLIPGAHYNVQEGSPDTVATVGQPISSITGTSVSTPQDVYVPTVDNNYNIGYDPENDGMAQIVINPADTDADYALIDENGNVVQYPGSDNGWMTPVGNNPSTVTFNNLNPNETYTVVARKKGDSSIPNPLTKLPDGNQIIANPGDMADAPKYVVETKGGSVVTVGTTSVGNDTYDQAKAGEGVVIHADPVDANGKNFLYWQVLAGRAVGVSGNITQADYSFTLSNSNIVLKAVYEPTKVAGDDADLTETIRGGSVGEFGLTPGQIPGLAHDLTTPLDRTLNSVNGATVEYKVVFNKRDAKPNEKTAVKPVSVSGVDHPDAHTTAYGLDIKLERYVNGRLVNNGILATASNATVDVIAQLPAEDVDQLDYQLFDVTPDSLGNINPVDITITTDVANNAGLLKFTGNLQHSYVLVYSKTFKVTFVDNKPVLDHLHLNDTSRNFYKKFKVRRKENVEDAYYSSDYAVVTAYAQNNVANGLVTPFEDIYGVQYDYVNWSKKEDKLSVYDTTSPVTKRTIVYAYYSDNRKEVAKARVDLGGTIEEAKILTGDPYLKVAEVAELNEAIAHAVETLRQARDLVSPDGTTYLRQANWAELQQAIDALRRLIDKYSKIAADRAGDRNRRTGGASGGGNSSSGRGSRLLTPGEKSQQNTAINENSNVRAFVLGVDGAWEKNPVTGGWSFVLNGGTPLNDMWGMITFNDNTGKRVSRWYYFDGRSTMATGWVYDSKNGNWYYMNTTPGPELGQMVLGWVKDEKTNKWYYMNDNTGILKTGWHLDKHDGRWYYLNSNGEMLVGWQKIDGKWYYFNTNTPQNTYTWDANAFKWSYLNNSARPFGSMYAGEKTPDGYNVDANGAWY